MNLVARLANRMIDIAYLPGTEPIHRRRWLGRAKCFLYHRVVDPEADPFRFITRGGVPATAPAELARDLRFLTDIGARFLTFDEIVSGDFPRRDELGIVIAFDDCFKDNHTIGRKIIDDMRVKAVFFQTSGLIDESRPIWEHALYWYGRDRTSQRRLKAIADRIFKSASHSPMRATDDIVSTLREVTPYQIVQEVLNEAAADPAISVGLPELRGTLYPTGDQVRATYALGHQIGCHGHLHLKRATITAEDFRSDLAQAHKALTAVIGSAPRCYSFPFSSHMPGDESICREFFDIAATVERHRDIDKPLTYYVPRFTWPGPAKNELRRRRWLLTGTI